MEDFLKVMEADASNSRNKDGVDMFPFSVA